jgi:hypothetical protein
MGYYDTEYKIIGTRRDTGKPEIVYHGYDYSNVSDMMLNPDEDSSEFSHMSLFEDGRLTEDHDQPLPQPGKALGEDLVSCVLGLLLVAVVVLLLMAH